MLTEGVLYDMPKPPHSGEMGPGNHNHRHCEPVGRGNLLHHVSARMAPINIVYPGFSMLIYIPAHPTAAVEIARR